MKVGIYLQQTHNDEDQLVSGQVLLIFDGHDSHVNFQLVKSAKERGIHFICLPPNTTNALQPLDVGIFKPMKLTGGIFETIQVADTEH